MVQRAVGTALFRTRYPVEARWEMRGWVGWMVRGFEGILRFLGMGF